MCNIASVAFLVGALLAAQTNGYGFDCSFPIHNVTLSRDCGDFPDRSEIYKTFMEGCRAHYNQEDCDDQESTRLRNNRLQPQSMVVRRTI